MAPIKAVNYLEKFEGFDWCGLLDEAIDIQE